MLTFIIIAVLILVAVSAPLSFHGKATYKNKQPQQPTLEDYDYTDNLCNGNNVTAWKHDTVCPTCLKSSTHEERMTDICLGCGKTHDWRRSFKAVAVRKIIKNGKWVEHMKMGDKHIFDRKY